MDVDGPLALVIRRSGPPGTETSAHTVQAMVDDVAPLLTGLGVAPAVVLGHSLGGQAASTLAALQAYQDERLPATTEIVLRNRIGGPELVIDEVAGSPPSVPETAARWPCSDNAGGRPPCCGGKGTPRLSSSR